MQNVGPSRDLNPGPPAPKAGIIATRPHGHNRRSNMPTSSKTTPSVLVYQLPELRRFEAVHLNSEQHADNNLRSRAK